MRIAGIITEYNPFHNGHTYHLKQSRALTRADYIIVVMSGDYVQRGMPALSDKYLRCEMALSQGADLVLELPTVYATASAEAFAMGAVALLDKLGVVDALCFGSECGDIRKLAYLAGHLKEESPVFQEAIKKELKAGQPYPVARFRALESCRQIPGALNGMEELEYEEIEALLKEPNNILALEYLKALQTRNSPITPYTIERKSAGYHSTVPEGSFASATAIRSLYADGCLTGLSSVVPESVFQILKREYQQRFPIFPNDFSMCLYYRLLMEQERSAALHQYQDTSKELGIRIYNELPSFHNYEEFAAHIKTRQYTLTRINRSLLHILLNIRSQDLQFYSACDYIPYARVLGFRKASSGLLSAIKKNSSIPLITKLADAKDLLRPFGQKMLSQDVFASSLYQKLQEKKFHTTLPNEYTERIRIF